MSKLDEFIAAHDTEMPITEWRYLVVELAKVMREELTQYMGERGDK